MVRSVRAAEAVLTICVAVTPQRFRAVREEQWRADLRDGPDLGISPSSLVVGAICSSATARFFEIVNRGNLLLSHFIRGKNMKLALGIIGTAVVIIGGSVVGVQAMQPQAQHIPPEAITVMGYEGWWNSTPVEGSAEGLPQETVSVNTTTGQIVDAFNRAKNDAHEVTLVSDVDFEVVRDSNWPENSVVIIDTTSGKVIESFPVDEKGQPIFESAQ